MFQRLRAVSRQVASLRSAVVALYHVLNPLMIESNIPSASWDVIAQWKSQSQMMKLAIVEFLSATKPAVIIMKTARHFDHLPKYQEIYQKNFASLSAQDQALEVRVSMACIDMLTQTVELAKVRDTLPSEAAQALTAVLLTGKDVCLELALFFDPASAQTVASAQRASSVAPTTPSVSPRVAPSVARQSVAPSGLGRVASAIGFALSWPLHAVGVWTPSTSADTSAPYAPSADAVECANAMELLREVLRQCEARPLAKEEECTMYSEEELQTLESELEACFQS